MTRFAHDWERVISSLKVRSTEAMPAQPAS